MAADAGTNVIDQAVMLVLAHLRGMWRYRWYVVGLTWCLCGLGWLAVYLIPDRYEASTDIYVDTESMLKRIVGDITIAPNVMSDVAVVTRALLTRPQLERVAQESDLRERIAGPKGLDRIVGELGQSIAIRATGQDIYRISYRDPQPAMAFSVVQTLLDAFVQDALGKNRADSGQAVEFIDSQVAAYEMRLREAEARLTDFKRQNLGTMPDERGDYYKRMQTALADVDRLKRDLGTAERREQELRRQLEGEEPTFGLMMPTSQTDSALDARITQYEAQLEDLRLKYTDRHPDIVAIAATLERLRQQRDATGGPVSFSGRTSGDRLATNPVHQQLRLSLSSTEVEIATLRERIAEGEAAVDSLRARVDTILDVERQLAALNRDYEVTRDQYETLLRKRETLHMTGEVEQAGQEFNFQVLDPPRLPTGAVSPKRGFLLAAALVVALGASLGLAFVLDQIFPMYTSSRALGADVGLPVIGSVSLARSDRQVRRARRGNLLLAASFVVLFVALGAAMFIASTAAHALQSLLGLAA